MDLAITHQQSQRLLKQRNLLAASSLGLFAASLFLAFAAAGQSREIVLQPVLPRPLTITSGKVNRDYLELVTRDAALLMLNRSPSNLTYWMDAVLALADPKAHGRMKAELLKVVADQSGTSVSQYFTMERLTVDPAALTSEVNGTLHTVVGSKEVSAEARTFRFVWSYSGVSLRLVAFGQVQPAQQHGEEA
ncbi:MAG: type IV conjugative transfer system protein TraE [Novosphingobium sp.]|uniref:type IV conjugative transfer system protein TraE n=1 Tax=Novosphingobium sp. TaxID=1874826 RepID=UPI002735EECC|nr:type IV conjugative transfer system protein TraE [Novosphingobium sp.]MDP3551156.1 type IV conjugative transfer system protein TraE [Novosphingobium sp.]